MKVSRSKISNLLLNNIGRFCSVTFIKKNGETRTVNGKPDHVFMSPLGYINFITNKGNRKQVDPRTVTEASIGGIKYKARK